MVPNQKPIDPKLSQYAWFTQGQTNWAENDVHILFYWDAGKKQWILCPGAEPDSDKGGLSFVCPAGAPRDRWTAEEMRLIRWWYENPGITKWATVVTKARELNGFSLRQSFDFCKKVLDRLYMENHDHRAGGILVTLTN